jgi:hypothetical protein
MAMFLSWIFLELARTSWRRQFASARLVVYAEGMQESYDVAVMAGGFFGAATVRIWLHPELRDLFLPTPSSAPVGCSVPAV